MIMGISHSAFVVRDLSLYNKGPKTDQRPAAPLKINFLVFIPEPYIDKRTRTSILKQ